jgi:hypothetical protein
MERCWQSRKKPAKRGSASEMLFEPHPRKTMPAKKTTKKVAAKKTAEKAAPAKKAAVKKAAEKKTVAKKAPAKKAAPSIEAVAKAAYLNYRRRVEEGLPGCHDSDWLEAERSLAD